jgi:hypothetical protein
MSRRMDLTGKVFGRWTVISFVERDTNRQSKWKCVCLCGEAREVAAGKLLQGKSSSCGCLRDELIASRFRVHGETIKGTSEYTSWKSMLQRCSDPNSTNYPRYGGRGITVCDRWKHSFENFLADMGRKPSSKHSIEREENEGNYEPANCRWATSKEQSRNRRSNRMLTLNGRVQCLADWADETGLSYKTIQSRLLRGWSEEKTLTTPVKIKV